MVGSKDSVGCSDIGAAIGLDVIVCVGWGDSLVCVTAGLSVGVEVGLAEGDLVTLPVGLNDGGLVGLVVGENVGISLGAAVGLYDGDAVVLAVGEKVGPFIGTRVGPFVGAAVRAEIAVGSLVGISVGSIMDASGVGSRVESRGDTVGINVGFFCVGLFVTIDTECCRMRLDHSMSSNKRGSSTSKKSTKAASRLYSMLVFLCTAESLWFNPTKLRRWR